MASTNSGICHNPWYLFGRSYTTYLRLEENPISRRMPPDEQKEIKRFRGTSIAFRQCRASDSEFLAHVVGMDNRTVDTLTPSERSARMARVRGRNSKPEMIVRRLVHAMGFRYRLHDRRLPGSPDLVFRRLKKVIFVHGCFWHRHPDIHCKLARMPKSRLDFWEPKLQGNRERDLRHQGALETLGWKSLVVWECELRHREQLQNKLSAFLTEGDMK